jgi:hypothetical protein
MRKFSVLFFEKVVIIIYKNSIVGEIKNVRFDGCHLVTCTIKIPVFKFVGKAWTIKNALIFRAFS